MIVLISYSVFPSAKWCTTSPCLCSAERDLVVFALVYILTMDPPPNINQSGIF